MIRIGNKIIDPDIDGKWTQYIEEKINQSRTVMEAITDDFKLKAVVNFDNHVKSYIMQSLDNIGYYFKNDKDFTKFSHERLTRVIEEKNPDDVYLFIDYETTNEKMIGKYSNKITQSLNAHGWTINFG